MKLKIFAIKDIVVGQFQSLILFNNENEAKRAVKDAIMYDKNIAARSGDLQLFRLGEYDTFTGELINDGVHFVLNFIDYVGGDGDYEV